MWRTTSAFRTARLLAFLILVPLAGCAHVQAVRDGPTHDRLQRLAAAVQPHTDHLDWHYQVQAAPLKRGSADLMVFRGHEIVVSDRLMAEADDLILAALLAHAMAHDALGHPRARNVAQTVSTVGFTVADLFIPFAGMGEMIVDPLLRRGVVSARERSADDLAITYLERMGYTAGDYLVALEFMRLRKCSEQTGKRTKAQKGFSGRIRRIRWRI